MIGGAALQLVANELLDRSVGLVGEPHGTGRLLRTSRWLTVGGAAAHPRRRALAAGGPRGEGLASTPGRC
ncbi:hypothetical protein BJF81_06730 [Ornithinimicrobium sp. CNJ-824]|nr:hypothetical protein BJF81_06730 [Ornithinimicrobium sp. CNJ-824]